MQAKTGTIISPSSVGVQNYELGFEPSFICFYYGETNKNMSEGFGIACNATPITQAAMGVWKKGQLFGIQSENSAIVQDGSIQAKASSFHSTGFSLNWVTTQLDFSVNYWAVGDNLSCKLMKISTPTVPSVIEYSNVGFQPRALLAFSGTDKRVIRCAQGFASSTKGQFTAGYSYPNPICFQRFDRLLSSFRDGVADTSVALQSFDIDGFTLEWIDVPAEIHDVFVLAIDGAFFNVGKDRLPSTLGLSVSTVPLQASTIMIKGSCSHCSFLGTATGSTNQRVVSTYIHGNSIHSSSSDGLLKKLEGPTAIDTVSGSLSQFEPTGYKLDQTTKDLADQEYGYFAISDVPPVSTSRLAARPDFERGEIYDDYYRYPFFALRAQILQQKCTGKILIVGCGWGFLIDECLSLGLNVWGCDASSYAIFKAQEQLPAASAARVMVGNCLSSSDLESVKAFAGLAPGESFDWCITEDMLPVLTNDAEVQAASTLLGSYAHNLLHFVTPKLPNNNQHPDLLWKSVEEWASLVNGEVLRG